MGFFCEQCDAEIDAPYEWGGISIRCPSCAHLAPLQYRDGQPITPSASGYGISFRDFVGLMDQEGWREQAQPLIAELLACSVKEHGSGFVLRAKSGALIPYEVAHLQIQAHPGHQRRLYDLAMDLWR